MQELHTVNTDKNTYTLICSFERGRPGKTQENKEFDKSEDFHLEKFGKSSENVTNTNDPYFDPLVPTKLRGYVGKSILLGCVVHNLGNKTVSWIRNRDLHILTVGSYTYTADERIQSSHHEKSEEWTLHIKWVQQKDKGMYECQVSTQPAKSFSVYLDVVGTNILHEKSDSQVWSSPRQQRPIQKEIYQQMYGDQEAMPAAMKNGSKNFIYGKKYSFDFIFLSCLYIKIMKCII
ncbi:uncharacterized protein LOC143916957 [Arctopsyche grandis]|uniref:uncharacterized protein LOC143916957 n=1 Tax=Arctopsyche grandis TaxID=121162 RepID=UPI00406D63EB